MDPHELLSSEHTALRKQAAALKTLVEGDPRKLAEALEGFQKTVQMHFKREDVYFRVVDDGKRVPDRALVHQLRNDHAAVVFTLESLAIRLRKNGVNPDWRTRFENMMNVLLPHLDTEDAQLFPLGKTLLTPEETARILEQIQNCD